MKIEAFAIIEPARGEDPACIAESASGRLWVYLEQKDAERDAKAGCVTGSKVAGVTITVKPARKARKP